MDVGAAYNYGGGAVGVNGFSTSSLMHAHSLPTQFLPPAKRPKRPPAKGDDAIIEERRRGTSFAKRAPTLFKKGDELAVQCGCNVLILLQHDSGQLSGYCNGDSLRMLQFGFSHHGQIAWQTSSGKIQHIIPTQMDAPTTHAPQLQQPQQAAPHPMVGHAVTDAYDPLAPSQTPASALQTQQATTQQLPPQLSLGAQTIAGYTDFRRRLQELEVVMGVPDQQHPSSAWPQHKPDTPPSLVDFVKPEVGISITAIKSEDDKAVEEEKVDSTFGMISPSSNFFTSRFPHSTWSFGCSPMNRDSRDWMGSFDPNPGDSTREALDALLG